MTVRHGNHNLLVRNVIQRSKLDVWEKVFNGVAIIENYGHCKQEMPHQINVSLSLNIVIIRRVALSSVE
jgi:hypothetical protein